MSWPPPQRVEQIRCEISAPELLSEQKGSEVLPDNEGERRRTGDLNLPLAENVRWTPSVGPRNREFKLGFPGSLRSLLLSSVPFFSIQLEKRK
jgi:hypothetical protein